MRPPDTIIVDGRAYSWRHLTELRRRQLEAWRVAQPRQLALFDRKTDCRPPAERSISGRYLEPSLLDLLR